MRYHERTTIQNEPLNPVQVFKFSTITATPVIPAAGIKTNDLLDTDRPHFLIKTIESKKN